MRVNRWRPFPVLAGLAGLLLAFAPADRASAQLFFDWGSSSEKTDDTGREVVRVKGSAKVGELIVSFGDRRVYFFVEPGVALSYPIAVPRDQSRWSGVTSVSMKREHPAWTPTPAMLRENPRLPPWVPGGHPMNPLGTRALYLGASDYRIHGTDAPWTIGTAASKGCVRMYNKDVQDLYPRVRIGAKVTVTYDTYPTEPITDAKELKTASIFQPLPEAAKTDDQSHKLGIKQVASDGAASGDAGNKSEKSEKASGENVAAIDRVLDERPAVTRPEVPVTRRPRAVRTAPATATAAAANKPSSATAEASASSKSKSTGANGDAVDDAASRASAAAERAAAAAERAAAAAEKILSTVSTTPASATADGSSSTVRTAQP